MFLSDLLPAPLLLSSLLLLLPPAASAAPYTPTDDAQVVETVPARASDPQAREIEALRQRLRRQPDDVGNALALSRRLFEKVAAEGDPRYIGYIEAALRPWLDQPDPPTEVRVMRAKLMQFDHRFDPALADLRAALRADPANGEAASWLTAILMVRADYAAARDACATMARLAPPLIGVACRAQVDAATGRAADAATALRRALDEQPRADPAERLWALTRLAETEERLGRLVAAEKSYRAALALGIADVYLEAAYADFLLDRARPADVLALLKDRGRADVLLLRLALAARAAGDPRAAAWTQEMRARFDAARLRGDTSHRKEESRFALAIGDVPLALALARENWSQQREPADARILLEAAVAARDAAAAKPVFDWLAASRIESVVLHELAARLRGRQ